MSELINIHDNRATIRWKLLTGASALALTAYVSSTAMARAEDSGQPQVWIELGGQLDRNGNWEEPYVPSFAAGISALGFTPPASLEHAPQYSFDEDAKISLTPDGSNWAFSAAIRYGRGNHNRHLHQEGGDVQNTAHFFTTSKKYQIATAVNFADSRIADSETHAIVDFQAGKDVGLGMFGGRGSSTLSVGVRIAQFTSHASSEIKSDQDVGFKDFVTSAPIMVTHLARHSHYRSFAAEFAANRSFHGVGPSLSWNGSATIAGNTEDAALSLDWGVNAAFLFGRQKTKTRHQESSAYKTRNLFVVNAHDYGNVVHSTSVAPPPQSRMRSITVPNAGGFAGISFHQGDAKISFGYRADVFFGAIDGGIDVRKSENRSFMGPYASISIGVGGSSN